MTSTSTLTRLRSALAVALATFVVASGATAALGTADASAGSRRPIATSPKQVKKLKRLMRLAAKSERTPAAARYTAACEIAYSDATNHPSFRGYIYVDGMVLCGWETYWDVSYRAFIDGQLYVGYMQTWYWNYLVATFG